MLDDQTSEPGAMRTCGAGCTRHAMTLTSEVDQKVWLTAHTWDKRCLAANCKTFSYTDPTKHSVQLGTRYIRPFWDNYDDLQLDPFTMTAGETIKVFTEWDWSDRGYDFSKDWSIVAWGEEGKVTITHDAGYETDHWPFIQR